MTLPFFFIIIDQCSDCFFFKDQCYHDIMTDLMELCNITPEDDVREERCTLHVEHHEFDTTCLVDEDGEPLVIGVNGGLKDLLVLSGEPAKLEESYIDVLKEFGINPQSFNYEHYHDGYMEDVINLDLDSKEYTFTDYVRRRINDIKKGY